MTEHSMAVETAHLHAGADLCSDAAQTALAAAGKLAGKSPTAAIFGAFAEAHEFHAAISATHQDQIERFHGHHRALADISEKSRFAAQEFTAQDAAAADSLRSAETGFTTA